MPDRDKSSLMRSVNEGIAFFAADLEPSDPAVADHWAFVCECGAPGCVDWVELELAEFAAIREGYRRVLAEGHALVDPTLALDVC